MQTKIKARPILFSGAMVRALLDGTKTQTRRVVKHTVTPMAELGDEEYDGPTQYFVDGSSQLRTPARYGSFPVPCPYGQPGDRLWVRETFIGHKQLGGSYVREKTKYRAKYDAYDAARIGSQLGGWKPSIFMPRELSRLLLEITAVRCERLQDISEADAVAEGTEEHIIPELPPGDWGLWRNYLYAPKLHDTQAKAKTSPIESYESLWASINGPGSWEANPWVWAVEFKQIAAK